MREVFSRLFRRYRPQQSPAAVERLPAEIIRDVLLGLDYTSLKALVRASPVFHRQYLFERRTILLRLLETLAGPGHVLVEAYFVYETGTADFDTKYSPDHVRNRISAYQRTDPNRPGARHTISLDALSDNAVGEMVNFSALIKRLTGRYAAWALGNLAKAIDMKAPHTTNLALSSTEEARIVRAMYRFELTCHLFGVEPHYLLRPVRRRAASDFEPEEVLRLFFLAFQPWEVEEITSIYAFVRDCYETVFDSIAQDVSPAHPRFRKQTRPPTPDGAFELDDEFSRDALLTGTSHRGLRLLNRVLLQQASPDHETLVATMQKYMCRGAWNGLGPDGALAERVQVERWMRQAVPSERDGFQTDAMPMLFEKEGAEQPPLAWCAMWDFRYSNIFGPAYVPESIRQAGFIFWDAIRLREMRADTLVVRLFRDEWGGDDPRAEFR